MHLRICLVSREYPPGTHHGGIGTYTQHTARALARLGHEVTVLTEANGAASLAEEEGVTIHRLPVRWSRPREAHLLDRARTVARTLASLAGRLDLVQASEFGAEAALHALRGRTPLVTRLATPLYLTEELSGHRRPVRNALQHLLERTQTRRSATVFSSTRALAERVAPRWGLDPAAIRIIPNALDIPRIRRLAEAPPPEGLPARYVLYLGRIEVRKGVLELSRAARDVLRTHPELGLVLAGRRDAGIEARMAESAGDTWARHLLLGHLPYERMLPLLRQAEAVVLPSRWEAFGFTCLEALALGRPVIATSGSGFSEIIEHDRSGTLVPPGDPGALAAALNRTLDLATDERDRLCREAARRAEEFDMERVAPSIVSLYEEVLARCG